MEYRKKHDLIFRVFTVETSFRVVHPEKAVGRGKASKLHY